MTVLAIIGKAGRAASFAAAAGLAALFALHFAAPHANLRGVFYIGSVVLCGGLLLVVLDFVAVFLYACLAEWVEGRRR